MKQSDTAGQLDSTFLSLTEHTEGTGCLEFSHKAHGGTEHKEGLLNMPASQGSIPMVGLNMGRGF